MSWKFVMQKTTKIEHRALVAEHVEECTCFSKTQPVQKQSTQRADGATIGGVVGVLAMAMALSLYDLLMIFHRIGSELASSRIEDSKFMRTNVQPAMTCYTRKRSAKKLFLYIFNNFTV